MDLDIPNVPDIFRPIPTSAVSFYELNQSDSVIRAITISDPLMRPKVYSIKKEITLCRKIYPTGLDHDGRLKISRPNKVLEPGITQDLASPLKGILSKFSRRQT